MTASSIKNAAFSKFTMALLVDSGWYDIEWSLLEPFYYGEGKGCDFVNKACKSSTKYREFCYT